MRRIWRQASAALSSLVVVTACASTSTPVSSLPVPSQPGIVIVVPSPVAAQPTGTAEVPQPPTTPPDPQIPVGPTPWPPPEPTPEPSGYDPLVGRWTYTDEFITRQFAFLPDGRYVESTTVGDVPLTESGVYAVDGSSLGLNPEGAAPGSYEFAIDGDFLTLVGGASPSPVEFALEPGSREAVIEDARVTDEREAQLDAEWRARLLVAPMGAQPPHIAVGEVPDDPNVTNIFGAPTVFVEPELYLSITLAEITYDDGSIGSVQNSTKWYFQPTGRLFTIFTNWPTGRIYSRAFPEPDVNTYWSRYTIQEGADTDRVLVQSDAGEQLDMSLAHGRRNLIWGNDVYGEVDWENEQLGP